MSHKAVYFFCVTISSSEIRERAIKAYQKGKRTQSEIASMYGISTRTFQRWYRQHQQNGSTQPGKRGHRIALYSGEELARLDRLVAKHPDATLDELRALTGKTCSIMAVQRAVVRLGYSLKKNAIGQRTKPSGCS